jgi:hypothetical protein
MIPALTEMAECAMQGGNLLIIHRHTIESRWLLDMGYVRFINRSTPKIEGGRASWRKAARRTAERKRRFTYEITQAGFDRLNKHGLLEKHHPAWSQS